MFKSAFKSATNLLVNVRFAMQIVFAILRLILFFILFFRFLPWSIPVVFFLDRIFAAIAHADAAREARNPLWQGGPYNG